MTDHACVICAKVEPADGWTVCRPCLDRIDDDLARIVELTAHAADRLVPETRPGNGGRTVPGSRPPLSVDALDAALGDEILAWVDSWERLTRDFYDLSPLGPATVAASRARNATLAAQNPTRVVPDPPDRLAPLRASIRFLQSWLLRIAETPHYPIDDLAKEARTERHKLNRFDPNRDTAPPGIPITCPADHPDADGRTCDQRLRTNGDHVIVCPRCHTHWTPDDLLDPLNPAIFPPDQLIVLDNNNGNPRERLRNWHKRGKIQPAAYAQSSEGRRPTPLYRLGEYRALLAAVNRLDNIVTNRAT